MFEVNDLSRRLIPNYTANLRPFHTRTPNVQEETTKTKNAREPPLGRSVEYDAIAVIERVLRRGLRGQGWQPRFLRALVCDQVLRLKGLLQIFHRDVYLNLLLSTCTNQLAARKH